MAKTFRPTTGDRLANAVLGSLLCLTATLCDCPA